MSVEALRLRAVVWLVIGAFVLALPWSRRYCTIGSLTAAALIAGAALAAVSLARRGRDWRRADSGARARETWPLLAIGAGGEELLFRGLGLRLLASVAGAAPAILLSAVAFGAAHRRSGATREVYIHAVTGVILAGIAWLTGGWLAGAVVHATYNGVALHWRPERAGGHPVGTPSEPTRQTSRTTSRPEGQRV